MRDRSQLIQEDYVDEEHFPWKVLLICQCLNRAAWPVAEIVVKEILEIYPDPFEAEDVSLDPESDSYNSLFGVVRCLGFGKNRAKYFVEMSRSYVRCLEVYGDRYFRYPVKSFAGCGQYAEDAWTLFVLRRPCEPKDRLLRNYVERMGYEGTKDKDSRVQIAG